MKAYSEDLRERVIGSVARGVPRADVVSTFAVSLATIERWVRRQRETGSLTAGRAPGAVVVKTIGLQAALPERLAAHADATLAEHCAWWREVSGHEISTATLSRAITRLGWTRKKRP